MISLIRLYRIFLVSASMAILVVALKYVLHILGFEPVEQSSLHNGVISSVTFVIGFLLSATIADYKESERMPSEFAAQVENMYDDAASIYQNYPTFDIEGFRSQMDLQRMPAVVHMMYETIYGDYCHTLLRWKREECQLIL